MDAKYEYIRDSLSSLEDAVANLAQGRIRPTINAAYHSTMQAAKADLMARGLEPPKSHTGLRRAFSKHFVRDGPLPRDIGRNLSHTGQLRSRADYAPPSSRTMEDADVAVQRAHAFVVGVVGVVFPELEAEVPGLPPGKDGSAPSSP